MHRQLTWPESGGPNPSVKSFLDVNNQEGRKLRSHLTSATEARLEKALQTIKSGGGDPLNEYWFIDVDASDAFMQSTKDVCPCITKSRGANGFFVTKLNAMMRLEEVMRCQGYSPEVLSWEKSKVSRCQWGQAMGDAMSLTILKQVLKEALRVSGLV